MKPAVLIHSLRLTLVCSLVAACAEARTWHILPDGTGDAPTIQAGIDSAHARDEVLLAPGSYTWTSQGASGESMIRLKRDLILRGESGAASTLLDALQHGRVLYCLDVGLARIEGLTITGGRVDGATALHAAGAGIYSTGDSRTTISGCIVRNNDFVHADQVSGAGISCGGVRIADCQVLDNRAYGRHADGGGVYCSGTEITGCTIRGNHVQGGDGYATGAGIAAGGGTIADCRVESNVNDGSYFGGSGGGIEMANGSILRCLVLDNRVGGRGAEGGGANCRGCTITSCIFVRNFVRGYGYMPDFWGGGAIAGDRYGGVNTITGCTLIANTARRDYDLGIPPVGGIALETGGTVNATIIAWSEGAACYGPATYSCTDLFGNSLGDGFCGVDGSGNFSDDPQFCATDAATSLNATIQSDSPCAAGNHPSGAACGLIGAAPVGCGNVHVEPRTWTQVMGMYR